MPDINGTTIPGSVAVPTWVLIGAIVIMGLGLAYLVKKFFEVIPLVTTAIALSTKALEENTEALRRLEK
jgi:hypothetical protein